MADTDCEIEYLDEDADIVQQCVQPLPVPITENRIKTEPRSTEKFLVKRDADNNRKRKRKEEEEDSDYDPSMEQEPVSPARTRKRKPAPVRKAARVSTPSVSKTTARETKNEIMKKKDPATLLKMRKKMEIIIPDYEDPLCLPVRALKKSAGDLQRLRSWNDVCIEHFKHCNTLLRPEKGQTKSSSRTIVLRNVVHKETGNHELAVWSKTCVENMDGVKKSEIFQSILPKYREKMLLNPFNLQWQRKDRRIHNVDEVILTKEKQKEEETLVVYKPLEKLSAVYKTTHKPDVRPEDEPRKALKEVVCCKVCAPCYQTSWRGTKKNSEKNINCPICARLSVSVYNLLTHVRAHAAAAVAAHRPALAAILARFVEYHYKCRVCSKRFSSIKGLRKHVNTHRGSEMFHCEVGSHMAS